MVHIGVMADTDDKTAKPRYRQRMPEDRTATPESAENTADSAANPKNTAADGAVSGADKPKEIGGPKGPEPTRFGDWERDGRCVDF